MNYLISQQDWGVLTQIPCHDVIEAKYTDGSLIQYYCDEDTYEDEALSNMNIVNEDSEIQYSNFKFNYLIIQRVEDNWINPILKDDGYIYFCDRKIKFNFLKYFDKISLRKFNQNDNYSTKSVK